ncbi:MAG TPA: glycosyltransferase [Dongiaceae bacterium]|nr:glycosyltransferase [Dongiaceae bacterium]
MTAPASEELTADVRNENSLAGGSASPSLPGLFLMIDSLQTGGSERQFVALTRSLDRNQFRVSLGCIQPIGPLVQGLELAHFPLGGSLYGIRSLRSRIDISRHMRRNHASIAHAFDFYSNLTLIPAAKLAGIPVVIGSQRQLGDLLTNSQSRAQTMMFRWCDAVVCNSHAAASRLIDDGLPKNKTRVIWNGIGPEVFASIVPALPKRPGWRRVGMIARMNSRAKNHSLFLRAAARVLTLVANVEFVLVGDGPLRLELEREAASLGLGERVKFLGDRRDIPAMLGSLDITALPSDSESLSNAIIESMAAGVPVVATNVGGNSELLAHDRGTLVAPRDEAGLAAAIIRLLQDNAMQERMGHASRVFAEENFTLDKMRRSHEQLYMELLARKGWKPQLSQSSSA